MFAGENHERRQATRPECIPRGGLGHGIVATEYILCKVEYHMFSEVRNKRYLIIQARNAIQMQKYSLKHSRDEYYRARKYIDALLSIDQTIPETPSHSGMWSPGYHEHCCLPLIEV
jgi:hypothetical protein